MIRIPLSYGHLGKIVNPYLEIKLEFLYSCALALSNRNVSENDEKTQYLSKAEKQYQNVFLKKIFLGIKRSKSLE